MKKEELLAKSAHLVSVFLILLGIVPSALAQEIVISGNGSGASSEVNATSTQQTNVAQSNSANVNNNVATNSNTGENTASENTGGNTSIQTGNISTSTDVSNTLNNSNAQVNPCNCDTSSSTKISGNGANSTNTVNNTINNQININVNQSANIANNLSTKANTGKNIANNNSGNVNIKTGNINALTSVANGPVNVSNVFALSGDGSVNIFVNSNGTNSINSVNYALSKNTNIAVNNYSDFLNIIGHDLNTGGNSANGNNGDVEILTGDIWSEIKVKNLANISNVHVDCGCPEENKPPIVPPGVITPPPSNGGGNPGPSKNGGGTTGGGSQAVAEAIKALLPITGGYWMILALFGNVMMLLLGAYLRLRSGRSPGFALSV